MISVLLCEIGLLESLSLRGWLGDLGPVGSALLRVRGRATAAALVVHCLLLDHLLQMTVLETVGVLGLLMLDLLRQP